MRPKSPRVPPLEESEWSEEQRSLLMKATSGRLNIFRTLIRHPSLYRSWMTFASHVLGKSTLDARSREIVILRTGHLCNAAYEFHQHRAIAKRVGLTEADIEQIKVGPSSAGGGLAPFERVLLQAADELHTDACIGDETWKKLSDKLDTNQLMDLLFTVGQYTMVSMVLNSLGVAIEPT